MTAMSVAERMTADEFLALSEHELRWAELVGGEVVREVPTLRHQRISAELLYALISWTRAASERGLAVHELMVDIGDREVYQPDLVWYAAARVPERDDLPAYAVPDLAVEVRSPSTWRYDIGAKKAGYERRGVRELWLVDTAADEVLAFRRSATDASTFDVALELTRGATLTLPLLPGLRVKLATVFGE